jgi:hypothetical protein
MNEENTCQLTSLKAAVADLKAYVNDLERWAKELSDALSKTVNNEELPIYVPRDRMGKPEVQTATCAEPEEPTETENT